MANLPGQPAGSFVPKTNRTAFCCLCVSCFIGWVFAKHILPGAWDKLCATSLEVFQFEGLWNSVSFSLKGFFRDRNSPF